MENASKALIMGAEILLGVMIISIGVYLFSVMGQYSAETAEEIENTRLQQFNEQFTRYYGSVSVNKDGQIVNETIKCTLQDIVGVANLAKMYNNRNGFEDAQNIRENPEELSGLYYIQVYANLGSGQIYKNLESKSQEDLINILKDNGKYGVNVGVDEQEEIVATTKYFKVKDIRYSDITKRVNYIEFVYDSTLQ